MSELSISEVLDLMDFLDEQKWSKSGDGKWRSLYNDVGQSTEELLDNWISNYK